MNEVEKFNTLSVRAQRVLKEIGIKTIYELADKNRTDLLFRRDVGKKTILEYEKLLRDNGLWWKDNPQAIKREDADSNVKRLQIMPVIKGKNIKLPVAVKKYSSSVIKTDSSSMDTLTKINNAELLSELKRIKQKFTFKEQHDPIIQKAYTQREWQISYGTSDSSNNTDKKTG